MRATIAGIFCVTAVHSTATRGQTETFRSVEFSSLCAWISKVELYHLPLLVKGQCDTISVSHENYSENQGYHL